MGISIWSKNFKMKDYGTIAGSVRGYPSKYYQYDDGVIDRLFFNNLDKADLLALHDVMVASGKKISSKFFYTLNSLKYRSEEFYSNPEVIFSGCSFTYGMGLEEEYLWTDILAKKINKKYINLALPGKSTSSIINNLYSYIREYGKPEYIFCLFPNFNRFELPINPDIIISERNLSNDQYNSSPIFEDNGVDAGAYIQDIIMYQEDLSDKPKYSKKPHVAENILSTDISYWTAIKHILLFEQYCEAAGIKFFWTTWEKDLNIAINLLKDRYLNQYKNFMLLDEGYESTECHQTNMMENKLLWDNAGDRDRGIEYAHPGIHFHIHVAEAFYKELAIDEI